MTFPCGPDPQQSIFAGMSQPQLRAALAAAQQALIDLTNGNKRVSISYTQGESAKSATFTKPEMGNLAAMIRELQWMLGIVPTGRSRSIGFQFRP